MSWSIFQYSDTFITQTLLCQTRLCQIRCLWHGYQSSWKISLSSKFVIKGSFSNWIYLFYIISSITRHVSLSCMSSRLLGCNSILFSLLNGTLFQTIVHRSLIKFILTSNNFFFTFWFLSWNAIFQLIFSKGVFSDIYIAFINHLPFFLFSYIWSGFPCHHHDLVAPRDYHWPWNFEKISKMPLFEIKVSLAIARRLISFAEDLNPLYILI